MFETATISYGPASKRVWTTAMGFSGQAVLLGCLVLAPMVWPQTMGRAFLVTSLVTPGAPLPPLPPGPTVVPQPHHAVTQPVSTHALIAPVASHVPAIAAIIVDPPEVVSGEQGSPDGVAGGVRNGVPGGIPAILTDAMRPIPAVHNPQVVERQPVVTATLPPKPLRITVVRPATPIYRVEPIYPQIARAARVQGVVDLLGVLGTDGRIHELKVLRGHPMLVAAALDAVRQWVYAPTLLNGQPVEVSAPITVTFILK